MEKEQKKLLLVAVSVGVFLLVTITAAIIILTPRTQTQGAVYSSYAVQPGIVQPNENAGIAASTVPQQPVINNPQETYINTDTNLENPAVIDRDNGDSLTIQIPRPSAAAVPETSETSETTVSAARTQVTAADGTAASRTAPVTQQAPAVRQTPAVQQTAASQSSRSAQTSSSRTINDYWIQTGAFTAKIRAEDAKDLLASKGLTSIIENREIDGRIWYRVRLGPYTSENEANYWLALVKAIDGFGDSQVRQTTRQQ